MKQNERKHEIHVSLKQFIKIVAKFTKVYSQNKI